MDIIVARSETEIYDAFARLSRATCLGCDTETSGFSAKQGKLFSVQFSDGELGVLIPVSEGVALGPFGDLLAEGSVTKIFHNAKFDLEFLNENGHTVNDVFDTMIAEKVLTRGAGQSASLAETLYRYFAVDLDKTQRVKFGPKWNGVWTDALVDYALSDVFHLPRLMAEQMAWLEKLDLIREFEAQMQKVQRASFSSYDRSAGTD